MLQECGSKNQIMFKDPAQSINYVDTASRIRLEGPNYVDTVSRIRLKELNYVDTARIRFDTYDNAPAQSSAISHG